LAILRANITTTLYQSKNTQYGIITYKKSRSQPHMIKKFPLLPFIIFAGALISTATIGLPVFAG